MNNLIELGKKLDELKFRKTELNDLIADALLSAETGDMVAMAQVAALKKERGDLNDLISDTESLIIRLTTVEAEQRRSNLAELKARIEHIQKLPEEVKSDLDKVDNALANLAKAWEN
jgi:DNA repair exonuclease SbcCD ATPase subunit